MRSLLAKMARLFGVRPVDLPLPTLAELASTGDRTIGAAVNAMVGDWRRFGVAFTTEQQAAIRGHIEEGSLEGLVAAQGVILAELERCFG